MRNVRVERFSCATSAQHTTGGPCQGEQERTQGRATFKFLWTPKAPPNPPIPTPRPTAHMQTPEERFERPTGRPYFKLYIRTVVLPKPDGCFAPAYKGEMCYIEYSRKNCVPATP